MHAFLGPFSPDLGNYFHAKPHLSMGMESPAGGMERSSRCSWDRDGGDWVGARLGILKALLAAQINFSVPLQTSPLAALGLLERQTCVLCAGGWGQRDALDGQTGLQRGIS